METIFKSLATPTRRRVFERLVARELTVTGLTAATHISQPAVSQHIADLRKAGLLTFRKRGRETLYRADVRSLAPLIDWIAEQDRFWRSAKDRLDASLNELDE